MLGIVAPRRCLYIQDTVGLADLCPGNGKSTWGKDGRMYLV